MIKILQIFGEPLSNGGQESFIMNMYRNIDRSKVQFDFFTPFYCDNDNLKKEIEILGGNVYASGGKFTDKGDKKDLKKYTKDFLKTHKYDTIHIHSGSIYSLMIASKLARKSGAKNVIVHSHCGGFDNIKYRIIKILSIPYFLKYPTHFFACSDLAAEWKFPKKIIKNKKYTVLKNAIDTTKLYYSEEIRKLNREKMKLENKLVIGHIGRFSIQKNHSFLVDIFNEIQKQRSDVILLLIGVGELQDNIKKKVRDYNIEDKVRFLNLRKDINELLNVMDVFLLPSFFEGLPVVGVEAEATGLPVFMSENVTKELPLKDLAYYYSLQKFPEEWSNNIINVIENFSRRNTTEEIKEAGYDVKIAANKMLKYYLEMNR